MKRNIFKILGLAMLAIFAFACTAEQDVEPVVSPENYPQVTFTPKSTSTTITEGDTLVYTIAFDKTIDRSVTFAAKVLSGTADEHDFIIEPAVLEPYTKTVDMLIIVTDDGIPELNETLKIEIGAYNIADRYLVNPNTVKPTVDLTLKNYNDPGVLTVAMSWENHDDDLDIFALFGTSRWGAAASSDNPEILTSIWPDDPNGTYYVGVDPYLVNQPVVNYTIAIGHPNQTVEFFNGTFNTANLAAYATNSYSGTTVYRVLTIVNNNGVFTITHHDPAK